MVIVPDSSPVRRRRTTNSGRPFPKDRTEDPRAVALRRVVAEVSGNLELDDVLRDILDSSRTLFGAEVAGLWLLVPGPHPLRLAAHRNLAPEVVEAVGSLTGDEPAASLQALTDRRPIVLAHPEDAPSFADVYVRQGFRTINFVPLVFRDEALGLLALYHRTAYDWSLDELELCSTFANQMAIAVANARLFNTVRDGAARLRAIQELSSRLNRIQDVAGIGEAIVAEADRLIGHDTIRVYRVDHAAQTCEPIAFQGEFMDIGTPSAEALRVRIGEGLTGWVALHNRVDPAGRRLGRPARRPWSAAAAARSPCSWCRCRTSRGCWA